MTGSCPDIRPALNVIAAEDWSALEADLNQQSHARIHTLLDEVACRQLVGAFDAQGVTFRSTVDMARHGYGRGRYRYFAYPLPAAVAALRDALYPRLAPIANRWAEMLGDRGAWPSRLEQLTARCHAQGQNRPTPLLLRYGAGDYNCLHQDLYGAIRFPLQVVTLLSRPGSDFEGGELVLTEQRARRQSRPIVVPLEQGDAVIVASNQRPESGRIGFRRVTVRHGVSEVHSGERFTLGLIFHDAT